MGATRYASVLGLGFGDCGKGRFVDLLTKQWKAHTVVRFSGGAQAGHTVVRPARAGAPGLRHTFSQFGAGTLTRGTRTVLLDPMVLHPTALLVEAEALGRVGVTDALSRLHIDAQCRITTPYHQAAGRLRELLRDGAGHGTCGVGVGETVRHALEHPDEVIRYADFASTDGTGMRKLRGQLHSIRETLGGELLPQCAGRQTKAFTDELQALQDEALGERWLMVVRTLARHCAPASRDTLARQLSKPGVVLFEGAQGILLDEWRGFHPHTTWSSLSTHALDDAMAPFELDAPVEHYGVLRTYLTRHGAGPLPTHDEELDTAFHELHNSSDGWQGAFRRGHPDAVLWRYALEAVGPLSGLLVTHLDVFERGLALKWCERYEVDLPDRSSLDRLPLGTLGDLAHQEGLTQVLQRAQPVYELKPIASEEAYLERLSSVTNVPVLFRSHGAGIEIRTKG